MGGSTPTGGAGDDIARPEDAVGGGSLVGTGACAWTTLGELVSAVQRAFPELADIDRFYDPSVTTEDGFIYAFLTSSGFRVVFVRPRAYYYFETDAECQPRAVGEYRAEYDASQGCDVPVGAPLWGLPYAPFWFLCPPPLPPGRDVHGVYMAASSGTAMACGGGSMPQSVTARLSIEVRQAEPDFDAATVVIEGTGDARVDGRELPAYVTLSSVTALVAEPVERGSNCTENLYLHVHFDAELGEGSIGVSSLRFDCAPNPDEFCNDTLELRFDGAIRATD